jgi:adenylate cyclase, class 2
MAIEIEKKYRLDEDTLRDVLASLDDIRAEFVREDFEENTIYGGGHLDEIRAALRIRKTQDKTTLTFKRRIAGDFGTKNQIEHEVEVADHETLKLIVENIGFEPRVVYEKRRRIWKFRKVEIVLDELPFGLFMEIEGSVTAIAEAEIFLEIEDLELEHETYPRLARRLGKVNGEMVEARFEPALN